ncbi:protein phosphatase 1H-like isoform X2 [Tubulanus polymorphus]|uniref:protein phosphatase 1H-like isoform X2 n=1 Tax=Tubulanus polymorphus TaxID=672921 RepID=UPI003DA6921F
MFNRIKNVFTNVIGTSGLTLATETTLGNNIPSVNLEVKQAYSRPEFLHLSHDEVAASSDHEARLIVTPKDNKSLCWNSGYAEVINAGKSKVNEDQAASGTYELKHDNPADPRDYIFASPFRNKPKELTDFTSAHVADEFMPFTYFGIFDGHAGTGAALMAAHTLHHHIEERLSAVKLLLLAKHAGLDDHVEQNEMMKFALPQKEVTVDSLVIGALEAAFNAMDAQILRERTTFRITGGCTALVAVFILGKLYVANAGDSRAVICRASSNQVVEMSHDHTPGTERQRLQNIAMLQPDLLHDEFTHLEFMRRLNKRDLGKKMLHRDAHMSGWAFKTVTEDDLKFPLIHGEGKRTRVLATIGVTRGFGDHSLTVHDSDIYIKPFLSPMPEVMVFDLMNEDVTQDDVLVMGCDGLWDVTTHEECMQVVQYSFKQCSNTENKYMLTAQNLVMNARGLYRGKGWRINPDQERPASGDDISVFVIPIHAHKIEHSQRQKATASLATYFEAVDAEKASGS